MASNGLWVGYDQSDDALAKQLNDAEFPLWQMAILGMMKTCNQGFLMLVLLQRADKHLRSVKAKSSPSKLASTLDDLLRGLGAVVCHSEKPSA